jgi:hypothetical protein
MPPVNPTATPIPAQISAPRSIIDKIQQQAQMKGLLEALKKANVPDATATDAVNQAAQTQSQVRTISCHVSQIGTAADLTWVSVVRIGNPRQGEAPQATDILFPPNDPKYLAEFVRAQNYNLPIYLSLNEPSGQEPTVVFMDVGVPSAGVTATPDNWSN